MRIITWQKDTEHRILFVNNFIQNQINEIQCGCARHRTGFHLHITIGL